MDDDSDDDDNGGGGDTQVCTHQTQYKALCETDSKQWM